MQPKSKKRKQRAVVDTNVVVAGISGFREQYVPRRVPSADLLHRWAGEEHFVWLYSEDVLAEYKEVLKRLHVRSAAIGTLINIIRELGEPVEIRYSDEISPDPKDDAFCLCAEAGRADIIFT
ncbi:MAG: PIN domain-containing protein, partial [Terracidiphilus sp.]